MIAGMGLNPSVESAQRRSLAMESNAGTQPGAAAQSAGTAATSPLATSSEAAGQAVLGAEAVQGTPPQPAKIILTSIIRGAVSGAGLMLGVNTLGAKIPAVGGFMTKIISKIPFIAKFGFPMGTIAALGVGAAVGAVFGLLGGLKKSKKAVADYAASQPQQPSADPNAGVPPTGIPEPAPIPGPSPTPPPNAGNAPHNPQMGKDYRSGNTKKASHTKKAAKKTGHKYHIKSGDTLWALSRKYGVSISAIQKANAAKIKNVNLIYAGDTIIIPVAQHKKKLIAKKAA